METNPAPEPPDGDGDGDGFVARLRAAQRRAQWRIEASRETTPALDAAFVAQGRDRDVGGNLLACAIAYRLFLWLLPLALLLSAALGFAQAEGSGEPEEIASDVGLARSITAVVADAAQQAERSRWVILALALFGIYSAGGGGAKTMVAVHRFAWNMTLERFKGGAKASLAFTLGVVATLVVTGAANLLRNDLIGRGITTALLVTIAYGALWLGISTVLPHGEAPIVRLLPGALFFAVGAQILHLVNVYYLAGRIESSSELYGGLGFAATLLLGLYLVSRLIVGSAVLNATLWERAQAKASAATAAASPAAAPITHEG